MSAFIVAVISGVINLFIYCDNKKSNEDLTKTINNSNINLKMEINESNEKMQEKLSKNRIKADVVVSSRIKWIEEVRTKCSEYISSLMDYYNEYSNSTKKENFVKLSFKMKLYFSNNFNDNMSNRSKQDDENMKELAETILKEAKKISNGEKNNNKAERTLGNNLIKNFITYKNSNAGKSPFISMMFDNNLKLMLNGRPEEKEKNEVINMTIDVISYYLKIEWERVKNNE